MRWYDDLMYLSLAELLLMIDSTRSISKRLNVF
jgi:hypothetical protein